MVAKTLGAKVKKLPKRKSLEEKIREEVEKSKLIPKSSDEVPTIDELLSIYGGKGVVLSK